MIMSTIQTILQSLIGSYSPVSYTSVDGVDIIPSGLAGVDWSFIFASILFVVAVYSLFRLIGSIISKW